MIRYTNNPGTVVDFEKPMRRKAHYVIKPDHSWGNTAIPPAQPERRPAQPPRHDGFNYAITEPFRNRAGSLLAAD